MEATAVTRTESGLYNQIFEVCVGAPRGTIGPDWHPFSTVFSFATHLE